MKKIVFIIFLVAYAFSISAQQVEVRSYVGATYYQGDLSPLPTALSFSKGHLAVGSSVGLIMNPYVSFHTKFLVGKLSGSDSEASSIGRRRRNLSFETDLYEWGVSTELSINAIFKKLNKFGVNIYLSGGAHVFHFSPKARIDGSLVALQPLGTEGQGWLPGKFKYSLTELSISHGVGIKFELAPNVVMGVEVIPRRTFTDYIDDVSEDYINYTELVEAGGDVTAMLANRTGEYLGSDPVQVQTGTGRGNPNDKDWYLYSGMFVGYKFGAPIPIKAPKPSLKANGTKN